VIYNKGGGVRERSGRKVNKKQTATTAHAQPERSRVDTDHRSLIPSRDDASSLIPRISAFSAKEWSIFPTSRLSLFAVEFENLQETDSERRDDKEDKSQSQISPSKHGT
jgi:hypothetical protein